MATIGRSVPTQAWNVFEGLRTFDAKRACQDMADDVTFASPWSGTVASREAVEAWLGGFLGDVQQRPSLTVMDVSGDRDLTRFVVSVSGRFGRNAQAMDLQILTLRGQVHQVVLAPR